MKKKFAAFILCVLCLLSAVGCGQAKTDEQTPPTDQSAEKEWIRRARIRITMFRLMKQRSPRALNA